MTIGTFKMDAEMVCRCGMRSVARGALNGLIGYRAFRHAGMNRREAAYWGWKAYIITSKAYCCKWGRVGPPKRRFSIEDGVVVCHEVR